MGHSHAVSQRWIRDNPKLIAATTQFTRICLVFPQLIAVPSAVSDRLALFQKDFAALNTEMEVIIVLSSTQMDYQWSLLQGLFAQNLFTFMSCRKFSSATYCSLLLWKKIGRSGKSCSKEK